MSGQSGKHCGKRAGDGGRERVNGAPEGGQYIFPSCCGPTASANQTFDGGGGGGMNIFMIGFVDVGC